MSEKQMMDDVVRDYIRKQIGAYKLITKDLRKQLEKTEFNILESIRISSQLDGCVNLTAELENILLMFTPDGLRYD